MNKTTIKTIKQFKDGIDAAFETQQARDRFKARYDAAKDEFDTTADDLCAFAATNPDVFDGADSQCGWGATDTVEFTVSGGSTIQRADGGKLNDEAFLKSLPEKYVRTKLELNRTLLNGEGLGEAALAALGLARIPTLKLKLKAKAVSAALLAVALAATFSGCYVGKATFQGEDMRMYPFFSTTAATTAPTD